jgi:ribosome biogenesis GTPase A
MADARAHIRQNGVAGIEEFLKKKIDGSKSVTIRFGIVGNCGAGKSAFINAMRG